MMMSGYNIKDLIQEAQFRWLRPGEVLFILENYEETQLNHEPPQKPPSGSMFLFNKRVLRFFRKDGHSWRRKKDGKNVGEAHERLKVGNVEALNCYYAHGEENPHFQRRCYWMLDSAMEHIVLVHYRDITIGKHSAGPLTLGSSNIIQSSNTQLILSAAVTNSNSNSISNSISNGTERIEEIDASPDLQINQALKRLEEQLSLEHIRTFYSDEFTINDQNYSQDYGHYKDDFTIPSQQTLILEDMVTYDGNAACDDSYVYPSDKIEVLSTQLRKDPVEHHHSNGSSILPCKEVEDPTFPSYFPSTNLYQSDVDLYSSLFDQGQIETPLASDSSLTISQEQKFTIREISPEWGYATEPTKVVIVGRFTCDPSECKWICMFGETEVPVEIIQEGVICCYAPPHPPGKVTICITSGNREACSEVREFEYRHKPLPTDTNLTQTKTPGELLLLVKFVQILLSDKIGENGKSNGISLAGEDSWAEIIEDGSDSLEPSGTTDWLLEQLVKDKLQQWLSSKPVLSKKEQGIIHMVSGLGFVWALEPILKSGVGINFRDLNGWTALHWASRFGREKMVAELVARGAYAGAVTDPSQQDPTGKTAACIAETYGHKGLAGYLSEVALTSHLSSLTLKESELSKGSADVEAERTVNSIDFVSEDHLSLKDAIAAVRNSAQAASRIQAAFRAHSFKKRKQKEADSEYDEFGIGFLLKHDEHHHHAALSIQKKYKGYKGRKDFLTLRQKVVKIQAHVRGHQARKNYETICWAVGIVEKVILRWHRKGVGLRGFHLDSVDENEEDVVKVFRKQKVDVALSEAVSRVLSMVNSTQARQQYRRMLLKYQQAKAERGGLESGVSASQYDATGMETEDFYGTI